MADNYNFSISTIEVHTGAKQASKAIRAGLRIVQVSYISVQAY